MATILPPIYSLPSKSLVIVPQLADCLSTVYTPQNGFTQEY